MKIKGFLKLLFSRLFAIALTVILQVVILVYYLSELSENYIYVQIISLIVGVIVFISMVNKNMHPEQKILWAFLIMAFPIIGTVLYVLFNINNPLKKKFIKYYELDIKNISNVANNKQDVYELSNGYESQFKYLEKMTGLNLNKDTNTKFLKDGKEFYDSLIADLKGAKKFIFMEYFIIHPGVMWDSILEVLKEKVKEGVEVRFIYDDIGSCKYVKGNYYKKLRKEGIKCYVFNKMIPLVSSYHNNRDHRKITVIDGIIGYTGGINLSDEYMNLNSPYGHWQDNAIRLNGKGVDNLTVLFLQCYSLLSRKRNDIKPFLYEQNKIENIENNELVFSFGTGPKSVYYDFLAIDVFLNLINNAKKSIDITTPYLLTDFSITNALIAASAKGIKVRILFPGKPDKKLVWSFGKQTALELIKHGIEVYSYTPGFNHAKSFLVDDQIAYVGTTNLDYRSLLHHYECGTIIYNSNTINDIDDYFEKNYLKSKLLKEEDLKVNPLTKVIISFLRIFESLL